MICREIAKLAHELVPLSQRMHNNYYTVKDIRTSSDLFKYYSVRLSTEEDARLLGSSRPAIDHEVDIPPNHYRPSSFHTNHKRSSATYHTAHSGPFSFSNTHFPRNFAHLWAWRAFRPFLPLSLISWPYFKTRVQPLGIAWSVLSRCSASRDNLFHVFTSCALAVLLLA